MQEKNKKFAIKINKIKKYFDEKIILDGVSFSLFFAEKVALIGANGSGKSTLAKIIAGLDKADEGQIEIFKNFKISYLPQEFNQEILIQKYLDLENRKADGRAKLFEFLKEYGFEEEILLRKISSLSGGEKTKIFLIKIALENSEIIILDEPTNNLDSEGLEKLEKIINNSKSTFLIISHDRNFLDKTVSKIIRLDENDHQIKIYSGNYSDFLVQKEREDERVKMLYTENQKEKKKLESEIHRQKSKTSRTMKLGKIRNDLNKLAGNKRIEGVQNSAGKNLKRAKDKLENFDELENLKYKRPLIIDFSAMKKSGNKVLVVEDLRLEYGFAEKINLEVFAGDRILISGRNGSGKSTFIKTILQTSREPTKEIIWGQNVLIGYLPQNLDFSSDKNFLDYFMEETGKNLTESRKILVRFGFYDDEINININSLSPGMRARGKIATMLAHNPNVLILDEPTNNLDLEVLEELEKALKNYQGTIIFVSHDKYFIDRIGFNKEIKF